MKSILLIKSVQRFLASIDPLKISIAELRTGVEESQRVLDEVLQLEPESEVNEKINQLTEELRRQESKIAAAIDILEGN